MTKLIDYSRFVSEIELVQNLKELNLYGYTVINDFLTKEGLDRLLTLTEENYQYLNSNEKITYAGTPERNKDDKILYNLQNIDNAYIDLLIEPAITHIAKAKLNDPHYRFLPNEVPNYTLQYYNARSSGQKLDLHIDSHIPFIGEYTNMMQFVFLLEDSNLDNGCTVVVPGSHNSGKYTDRNFENVIPLIGKAGDLICWDSRLWHGTLENYSGKSRWALIATFGMWWIKPSMDIVRSVKDEIYKNCSDQQKQLLGFCSIPPINPFERNNTKCGYDYLKENLSDYNI